jgi:hypothetical protein
MQELLYKKLGGDIDVLLAGNLEVPITEPTLSTPAPSLQGVPSVAFPVVGGASRLQSSPFVAKKSLVATQDRVFPHYVPNSSIKHSKSDSKDRSQEIL